MSDYKFLGVHPSLHALKAAIQQYIAVTNTTHKLQVDEDGGRHPGQRGSILSANFRDRTLASDHGDKTMESSTKFVAGIFVVALVLRLSALAIFSPPPLDTSAEVAYWGGAQILTHGKGFSDPSYPVYAPPLYAVFIATCLTLFGDNQIPIKIAQTLLDSLTLVVTYIIMKEIFGPQTGILSSAILAIYPFAIYLSISIASEPLFTFFLSGFVLSSLFAVRSDKLWYYCVAGVLLGLATLTRATTQFVPLIFLVMLIVFRLRGRRLLFCYTAFCFSFALLILPWTVRNYMVLDDFIPFATSGGIVLLMGSSEKFLIIEGKPEMLRTHIPPPEESKPSQVDKFFTRAGLERHKIHLQTDSLGFLAFMARKFCRLWYATESGNNHDIILLIQLPIYLFALAGLVLAWMKGKSLAWIPVCIVAYFAALHWVALPLFRYMIPIMPYVIGFVAFAIVTLRNEWITEKKKISIVSQ